MSTRRVTIIRCDSCGEEEEVWFGGVKRARAELGWHRRKGLDLCADCA